MWFVGGGSGTDRAVPIKAEKVTLTVEKELVLDAAPLALAGESVGECSHFTARAEWLRAMSEFDAHGHILFMGKEYDLKIRFPGGHDPYHAEHRGHEKYHDE
jgi:hypothetical protein